MNPYRNALRQKKFEGLKIQEAPLDEETMREDAAGGDSAPEVMDDPSMANTDQVAMLGEMESEELPLTEEDLSQFVENAEATPDITEMTSEEIFGAPAPEGRPRSLRDRVQQSLKKRK